MLLRIEPFDFHSPSRYEQAV
jgi:hypothetical protein